MHTRQGFALMWLLSFIYEKNMIINILRTKHQHLQGKMKKSDIEGGYSISWSLHE